MLSLTVLHCNSSTAQQRGAPHGAMKLGGAAAVHTASGFHSLFTPIGQPPAAQPASRARTCSRTLRVPPVLAQTGGCSWSASAMVWGKAAMPAATTNGDTAAGDAHMASELECDTHDLHGASCGGLLSSSWLQRVGVGAKHSRRRRRQRTARHTYCRHSYARVTPLPCAPAVEVCLKSSSNAHPADIKALVEG